MTDRKKSVETVEAQLYDIEENAIVDVDWNSIYIIYDEPSFNSVTRTEVF